MNLQEDTMSRQIDGVSPKEILFLSQVQKELMKAGPCLNAINSGGCGYGVIGLCAYLTKLNSKTTAEIVKVSKPYGWHFMVKLENNFYYDTKEALAEFELCAIKGYRTESYSLERLKDLIRNGFKWNSAYSRINNKLLWYCLEKAYQKTQIKWQVKKTQM